MKKIFFALVLTFLWITVCGFGGRGIEGKGGGVSTAADVVAVFGSGSCSGYLKSDGTCDTPSGTGDILADGSVAMTGLFKADLSLQVKNGAASSGFVDFYEDSDNGSSYMRLYGPSALAGNIFLALPDTAGATGGQLYFSSANTLAIAAKGDANKIWKMGASDIPVWSDYTITGGTNTFNISNGTASLDIAAGATLNIDTSLQTTTGAIVLTGQAGGSSVTLPATGTLLAADGDGSSLTGLQLDQFVTQTAWRMFYSNADGDITELPLGTDGYLLKAKGASAAPEWSNTFSAQIDDSAAQFKHADSTATGKLDLQSVTADKGFTLTPVCTDNCIVTTPSLGSGTFTAVIIGQTLITRTEFIPVGWMLDGAAAPAALATVDLGTRQVKARKFQADTADQDLEMFWQAPNDIVDGDAAAGFQVKWRPIFVITESTTPASGEGVAFALQSCSSGSGDTGDCTVGTASVIADADLDAHVQYDVVYGAWTEMTVTDGAAGEAWFMKVYRDQDNAIDDYVQPVGLIGIELKYQTKPLNDY